METRRQVDKDPFYSSIVVCQDKIIVIDYAYETCKVLIHGLHDGKFLISSDRLESWPRDMCLIDAMTICVLHNNGLIKMMSIDSADKPRVFTATRMLLLEGVLDRYDGVVRVQDNLVVCGKRQGTICWCVLSLDDGHVDTINQICKGDEWCSVTTKDNIIYISCFASDESPDNGVYGFDILNPSQCKYTYKHLRLQRPIAIVVNEDGYIFVGNDGIKDCSCIHQLTASCQLVSIFTQGIPLCLTDIFCDHGRLYATRDRSSDITVFQLVYQVGSYKDSEVLMSDENKQPVIVETSVETEQGNDQQNRRKEDYRDAIKHVDDNRRIMDNPRNQEQSPQLHADRETMISEACNRLSIFKKQTVVIPNNPRNCQIVTMNVNDMRRYIDNEQIIGQGAFGKVFKAKMLEEETCKFVIKQIQVTAECLKKSYDTEIHYGRTLHPFINPVIARAESDDTMSERICYIMYPYMENRDLRHNIERVNKGEKLSHNETNSQIWTRCIYQMVQAVDFLHRRIPSMRESIFHRDLTSRNILLDQNFNVRIGDFGIAVEAKGNVTHATQTGAVGTDGYHPPSMNPNKYFASYDVFSVGVVVLEILTGLDAKLNTKPYYLYEKYNVSKSEYLSDDLNARATNIKNMAAVWTKQHVRERFENFALRAVDLDESQQQKMCLFQTLENEMRLNEKERYNMPANLDRCVSCCVNPIELLPAAKRNLNTVSKLYSLVIDHSIIRMAEFETLFDGMENYQQLRAELKNVEVTGLQTKTFLKSIYDLTAVFTIIDHVLISDLAKVSTKGEGCMRNEGHNTCQYFCIQCLMNHHLNPLVCPLHGKTRPPFGDHVYGVFVAGNDVQNAQQLTSMQGRDHSKNVAQTFTGDVEKVFKVLTSRHPFVLGVSKSNLRVVMPEKPGSEDKIEPNITKAFKEIYDAIKQAMKANAFDPEKDRFPNSLFMFYFSGHCSKEKGLQLGSTEEHLKASTTWIQEMLHLKLGVDQILIVLDCCHADSQNFTVTQGLNVEDCKKRKTKVSIVQLSSCDVDEKSIATSDGRGSKFTNLFCQGLLGLDMKKDDKVKFCEECEKRKPHQTDITLPCGWYHNQCQSDYGVTFYAMTHFIQRHFDLQKSDMNNPEIMTTVTNTQGEKKVYLAYYNPYKLHIPIHIKGCDISKGFLMHSQPDSMDTLRRDIMNHKVKIGSSDILNLGLCCGLNPSNLIAIYQKRDKDRECELTSLDEIYNARSRGIELEASVRDNIPGIPNGPVVLNNVNVTTVTRSGISINDDHLKINQNCIHIPIKTIKMAEKQMREIQQAAANYPDGFKTLISGVMQTIRALHERSLLEGHEEHVLKFTLNKKFSVLTIE